MMGYQTTGRALLAGIIVLAFVALAGVRDLAVLEAARPDPDARKWHRLHVLRVEGTGCQRRLGIGVTPWQYEQPRDGMLRYALAKWSVIRRDACAEARSLTSSPRRAVYAVFGEHGDAAWRVVMCESGGDPYAVSDTGDHGLFQINYAAHHNWVDFERIYQPLYNARIAYRLSDGGADWTPWAAKCRP